MLLWQEARRQARQIANFTPVGRDDGLKSLAEIALQMGARVRVHSLSEQVSGVINKPDAASDPVITINADEPMARKRFTLAHEIGHLIERTQVADDPDYSFIDYRNADHYDLHEFFADEFAGELLMPAEEFERIYARDGEYGASMHFGVSVPAVRARRRRLSKNPVGAE